MTLPDAIAVLAAMAEQRTRGPLAAPLANDAQAEVATQLAREAEALDAAIAVLNEWQRIDALNRKYVQDENGKAQRDRGLRTPLELAAFRVPVRLCKSCGWETELFGSARYVNSEGVCNDCSAGDPLGR